MKEYVTVQDWITSSGRYPERANSPELTQEVLDNAADLVEKVNHLLSEILWDQDVKISSGFRPSAVNGAVPNAAKRSAHMSGKAMDIEQAKPGHLLGKILRDLQGNGGSNGILGRNGLMMESLEATVGKNTNWVHLDTVKRAPRPSMEFKP